MKKILAVLLVCLIAAALFAACKENIPAGATTSPDPATTVTTPSTSGTDGLSDPSEPVTTTAEITSDTDGSPAGATTVQDAPEAWDTAKVLASYMDAVNKALAANGQVHKVCNTTIKKPLDADEKLAKLLALEVAGFNVQNTVCGLLGEGQGTYDQSAKEAVQACTLTVADLTSAKASLDGNGNTVLEIGVKGGINPMKNKSPLGRFTWDFCDLDTVAAGIADAENTVPGLKINIAKKEFNYSNVKIHAVISPAGKLLRMTHSYTYTAKVENVEVKELFITLGSGERASGSATGKQEYTFA